MSNPISRIDADIKAAMIAKEPLRLNTLRMLKSALKYYQIEKKLGEISEADLVTVAQKQIKQRQDAIDSFKTANRPDLIEKEEAELKVLQTYLPQALSPEELEALVKSVIAETGATGKAQMGVVMKQSITKAAGRADGKAISALVGRLLP
jgi:uncharacterized protein